MTETESVPQSLKRYLAVLRRQWWVTLLVTVIAIGAAAAYVATSTPVYSASMKIVVGQGETLFAPGLSVNVQPFTQTITDLLQSQVVARQTITRLGLRTTASQLLSNLSVSSGPETSVIQVTYNDPHRARAVNVLSTLGNTFTGLVNNALEHRSAAPTTAGQPTSQPVSVVIFDPAHADPGQVSPKTARTLAIAAVLGLLAGLLLAFLRDALSSRIRDEAEAEAAYGGPVIGALPRGALGLSIDQVETLPPALRDRLGESFRMLTARLRYSTGLARGVIVVTGARPEDGKTTVAAHIAAVLAASGNDVIAVEADLHRPALHRLLGIEPGLPGVSDVVARDGSLTSVLVEIKAQAIASVFRQSRSAAIVGSGHDDQTEGTAASNGEPSAERFEFENAGGKLRLLPAGTVKENAPNVLSLGNTSPLVSRLRALADYVVIDTPPLLLSGDAYPLVQLADAVIVVCREKVTLQDEARRARSILRSLGGGEFSLVMSESDAALGRHYSYAPTR